MTRVRTPSTLSRDVTWALAYIAFGAALVLWFQGGLL